MNILNEKTAKDIVNDIVDDFDTVVSSNMFEIEDE